MPLDPSLDHTAVVPQHVVHRAFAAETVMLNLQTGRYHGLNPSAGRMLELIAEKGRLSYVAEELSRIYSRPLAEMQDDLLAFCRDLMSRGLITLENG